MCGSIFLLLVSSKKKLLYFYHTSYFPYKILRLFFLLVPIFSGVYSQLLLRQENAMYISDNVYN